MSGNLAKISTNPRKPQTHNSQNSNKSQTIDSGDIKRKVYNNPANDYQAVGARSFQVLRSRRFKALAEDLLSILATAAGEPPRRRRPEGRPIPFHPHRFLLFCRIVLPPNGIIPPSTFLFFNCSAITWISRHRFSILCSFWWELTGLTRRPLPRFALMGFETL